MSANEWRDLPTMADVAAAQAEGDDIEVFTDSGVVWCEWNYVEWEKKWKFRARPAQPKMKKVKILGWVNKLSGSTFTQVESALVSTECIRYPKLDDEIEVPE